MQITSLPGPNIEDQLKQRYQSDNLVTAHFLKKYLELIHYLRSTGPEPKVYVMQLGEELWFSQTGGGIAKVWVDWYAYAPLDDGQPVTHYRIHYQPRNSQLSRDIRRPTVEEAEAAILRAFEESA